MRVEARAAAAAAAATVLLGWAATAAAQPAPPALLATCAACHGAAGVSASAEIPSIAGQPKVFVENQLVLIREGLREVPAMAAVLKGVSDEDIVALAKHYAALPPMKTSVNVQAAKQRAGAELSARALCGTCHLPGYVGQNQVPRLAGQHEPYLLSSMLQFRDNPGPGRDTIMASTLRGMSDADLAALAHYLAAAGPR